VLVLQLLRLLMTTKQRTWRSPSSSWTPVTVQLVQVLVLVLVQQ
jgi:hypothetical protein